MKRVIHVGPVAIGGAHPVSIQSMTKTATSDSRATLRQISALARAGCEIIRVALPDRESVPAFREIVSRSPLPVIADVHFDGILALQAIESGACGLRINPGNIGGNDRLKMILKEAGDRGIPIRIGANSGSIAKKYASARMTGAEKLVASVLDRIHFCEDQGFCSIKISLKSSTVLETVAAYRLIDRKCDYPLHVGITEAGTGDAAVVKSALGIGALLMEGIGNTIRVSLTADPRREVAVAREILSALELRRDGFEIVSCPTCARTSVDLARKVRELSLALRGQKTSRRLRVAVMGCEVNGPGEAANADIGLAFSRGEGYLFRSGKMLRKVEAKRAIAALCAEISLLDEKNES